MFKILKEALYQLIDECADELEDWRHIENLPKLYKEDEKY